MDNRPLEGCREILEGGNGFIQVVVKNKKLYFTYTKMDVSMNLLKDDLVEMCKKKNIPYSGTKKELCKRLKAKRQARRKKPYDMKEKKEEEKVLVKIAEIQQEEKDELGDIMDKLQNMKLDTQRSEAPKDDELDAIIFKLNRIQINKTREEQLRDLMYKINHPGSKKSKS